MKGQRGNMNRHQNRSHRIVRNPSYRQALQRLDELLEQNGGVSDDEKTKAMAFLAKATTATLRSAALEDLAWAIVQKTDFLFNY